MNQSLDEGIEFIFIDDCSTDNSLSVLRELVCKYPHRLSQIKIIENKSNIGVGASRQIGIDESTGNYIIQNDVDDMIENFFESRVSMRDFGNGREARVLLETAVIYAARRNMELNKEQYTKKDMQTLTNTDIALAIERLRKGYGKSEKNNNTIGFA